MKTNLGIKFLLFCSSIFCSHSGEENVHIRILDEVCANILENAKEVFQTKVELAKKQNRGKSPGQVLKRSSSSASNSPVSKKSCVIKSGKNEYERMFLMIKKTYNKLLGLGRPNTDLILVNKAGRPVRREGPKWEPERLEKDTLFILGSRANKVS